MKKDIKSLCKFFTLFQKLWIPYIIATLIVASRNFIITLLNASISANAVEMISYRNSISDTILKICIWVICFAIFDSMGIYFQTTIIHRMSVELRKKMFSHAINATEESLDKFGNRQELISRMNYDIDGATGLLSYGLLSPVMCCISGMGASIIIFKIDWKLCLITYILGFIAFLLQLKLTKISRKKVDNIQKSKTGLLSICMQSFHNSSLIRITNLKKYTNTYFTSSLKKYKRECTDKGNIDGVYGVIQGILRLFCFFGIFAYCFFQSNMKLEDIVYIVQISPLVATMILSISDLLANLQRTMVNIDRVLELFDLPLEENEGCEFVLKNDDILVAKDVACEYKDCSVNINDFVIQQGRGKMFAFIGPSGCGKTTLMRLILKLYSYSNGELSLFNQEVKKCNNLSLRSKIAYVPQENMIFPGTVRDNILFGNESNTIMDTEIIEVFRCIGAKEFIDSLGLETTLNENGTNLSGGQRQIIAIVRAILYKKPILILDEAFASIDEKYTSYILDYLVQCDMYKLVVTHNERITARCDKTILING
ncbi:ABC transporter ATP-binding protein [Methanobrevibacter ruminantium]|uniref:ABC transporter ATP-binding protein n=1 Tax=Methanobrevibacter ruminantium TaxID=83816 RepID=UPI0026ECD3EB|nr:ABC transporter ATP-binding protein [Methanobrevibacter ruminantium]